MDTGTRRHHVALLQMIVMPLVLIAMIAAVVRLPAVAALGKIGASVIGLLVFYPMEVGAVWPRSGLQSKN